MSLETLQHYLVLSICAKTCRIIEGINPGYIPDPKSSKAFKIVRLSTYILAVSLRFCVPMWFLDWIVSKFQRESKQGIKESKQGIKHIGWARSLTVGIQSKATGLVNNTKDYELWMRDKLGSVYGCVRYKIPPKSELSVTTQQHTYFQMIVYAIRHSQEGHPSSTSYQQDKPLELRDTMLTLDSDDLADLKRIEISYDEQKNSFKISNSTPRDV